MDKKHIELVGTMTLGPKGQVVIPAEVRENMGVKPGDKLVALYIAEKGAVSFVSERRMQRLIDKMGDHVTSLREQLQQK